MRLTFPPEIIDLPSGGSKRILDRRFNMFVPCVVGSGMIDDDIFVRRNCKPDVDLETGTMTVLMTRCYHSYTAPNDVAIVLLQSLYFASNRSAYSIRRIGSFKRQLQWDLHRGLSAFMND